MSARVRMAVHGGEPPLADYDIDDALVGLELLQFDDPQVIETLHCIQARFADEAPQLRSVEATSI